MNLHGDPTGPADLHLPFQGPAGSEPAGLPPELETALARDLVNLPYNDLDARGLEAVARDLAAALAEAAGLDEIVDLATLTGAKVTALGDVLAEPFSNNDSEQ